MFSYSSMTATLAAEAEAGSKQVIGSVGGLKIPPVDRYIAGYQAGAEKANPGITTLNHASRIGRLPTWPMSA